MRKTSLAALLLVAGLQQVSAQQPQATGEAQAGPKLPPGVAETQGLNSLPDLQKAGRMAVPLAPQPVPASQPPTRPPVREPQQQELRAPIGQIGEGPKVEMPKGDRPIDTKEMEEHTRRVDRLELILSEAKLWKDIVTTLGGDKATVGQPTHILSGPPALPIEPPGPIADLMKKDPVVAKPAGWRAFKVIRLVRRDGKPAAVVDLAGARYEVTKDFSLGEAHVIDVTSDCVTIGVKAEQMRKCVTGEE